MLDHIRTGALDCSHGRTRRARRSRSDVRHGLPRGARRRSSKRCPNERRSHLLSATFPPGVRNLANRFQRDALHLEGTRLGAANVDIEHIAHLVRPNEWYAALVNLLLLTDGARTLVFVRRRVDTTELSERLAGDGFVALPLSGDLAQGQRTRTLERVPQRQRADPRRHRRRGARHRRARDRDRDPPRAAVRRRDVHAPQRPHRPRGTQGTLAADRAAVRATPGRVRAARRAHQGRVAAGADARSRAQGDREAGPPARARAARRAEGAPNETQLAYAAQLLEGRDPATVVAALLRFATPALPREPMPVSAVEVVVERRPRARSPASERQRRHQPPPLRAAEQAALSALGASLGNPRRRDDA